MKAGISPNIVWPRLGNVPLNVAMVRSHDEVAIMLIKAGVDVAVKGADAIPPVWASGRCQADNLVHALIHAGPDVNAKT